MRRLDQLLGGGLPHRTSTLVYGPPFIGKELMTRTTILTALSKNIPCVLLHTNAAADEIHEAFLHLDPGFPAIRDKGLLHLIDLYSRSVAAPEILDHTTYLDSAVDLAGMSAALHAVQQDLQRRHDRHLLVIDSLSTLIAHNEARPVFRMIQVLLGRARRSGATSIILMDEGMHSEAEERMFRHLMDGAVYLRDSANKHQIHVVGLNVTQSLGWIDYQIGQDRLEVTGSFAAGRIR